MRRESGCASVCGRCEREGVGGVKKEGGRHVQLEMYERVWEEVEEGVLRKQEEG